MNKGAIYKQCIDSLWRQYKLVILICALLTMQGCAVAKQVTGPDGQPMYAIDCSGAYLNSGHCLEKAGKICGEGGYEILGGYGANQGVMASAGTYGLFSAPIINRELWVRCKGAARPAMQPERDNSIQQ